MIKIYKPENTNFKANGDMPLLPEKALVHATLNGAWSLELQHPIDGRRQMEIYYRRSCSKSAVF